MWLSQTQFSVLWDAVPGLCGCAAIKVWQNAILVLKLDLRSAKGTCGLVGKDVWDWFCAGFRASESCWAQEAVTVRPRHADLSLYLLAEQANSPLTFRKLLPCSLGILLELSQTQLSALVPQKWDVRVYLWAFWELDFWDAVNPGLLRLWRLRCVEEGLGASAVFPHALQMHEHVLHRAPSALPQTSDFKSHYRWLQ